MYELEIHVMYELEIHYTYFNKKIKIKNSNEININTKKSIFKSRIINWTQAFESNPLWLR